MSDPNKTTPQLLIAGIDDHGQAAVRFPESGSDWSSLGRASASSFQELAIANDADGFASIIARDENGGIWRAKQTPDALSDWSEWTKLSASPKATSGPVADGSQIAAVGAGKLRRAELGGKWATSVAAEQVLVIANDLAFVRPKSGSIQVVGDKAVKLDLEDQSEICVAPRPDGRLEVFGRGIHGSVFFCRQNKNGSWAASKKVGTNSPGLPGKITAARNIDGRLEVYGVDETGQLCNCWESKPGAGDWSDWRPIAGKGLPKFADPIATNLDDGSIAVFVSGPGVHFWMARQKSPGKAPWIWNSLGSGGVSQIVIGKTAAGERVPGLQVQQLLEKAAASAAPKVGDARAEWDHKKQLSIEAAQRKVDEAHGVAQGKIRTTKFESIFFTSEGQIQKAKADGTHEVVSKSDFVVTEVTIKGDFTQARNGFYIGKRGADKREGELVIEVTGNGKSRKLSFIIDGRSIPYKAKNNRLKVFDEQGHKHGEAAPVSSGEILMNVYSKGHGITRHTLKVTVQEPAKVGCVLISRLQLDGKPVRLNQAGHEPSPWRQSEQTLPSDLLLGIDQKKQPWLFWTRATQPFILRRSKLDGSRAKMLYESNKPLLSLTQNLETADLYWIEGTGKIMRGKPDGGEVVEVLDISTNFGGEAWQLRIAEPGGEFKRPKLYWSSTSGIWRCNLDGSHPMQIVGGSLAPRPVALVIDNGTDAESDEELNARRLYWIDRDVRSLQSAKLDGSDPRSLFPTAGVQRGLAFDEDLRQLYWTEMASPAPLTEGLVADWNLDDADSAAADLSPARNHGNVVGPIKREETTTLFPGHEITTMNFAGSSRSDQSVVVQTPFQDPEADFSIAVWVCPTDLNPGFRGLMGMQDLSQTEWLKRDPSLWQNGSDLYFDAFGTDQNRFGDKLSNVFVEPNDWVHLSWIRKGDAFTFHRNGMMLGMHAAPKQLFSNGASYWIGRVDNWWKGAISRVKIWNRALSQDEIRDAMLSQSASVLYRGAADGSGEGERLFELSTQGGLALETASTVGHLKAIRSLEQKRTATLEADRRRRQAEADKKQKIERAQISKLYRISTQRGKLNRTKKEANDSMQRASQQLSQAQTNQPLDIAQATKDAKKRVDDAQDQADSIRDEANDKANQKVRDAKAAKRKAQKKLDDAKK